MHGERQRALLAIEDGGRHAKGARDAERFADLERVTWDGAHDEIHVDRIGGWRRALVRVVDGIAECGG